jgi:hypothetical protein
MAHAALAMRLSHPASEPTRRPPPVTTKADVLETLLRTADRDMITSHYEGLVKAIREMFPDNSPEVMQLMEAARDRDSMHYFFFVGLIGLPSFREYCRSHGDAPRIDAFMPYLQSRYKIFLEGRSRQGAGQRPRAVFDTYLAFLWDVRYEYLLRKGLTTQS